ncbi:MAG: type I polyketide synthase, partial [Candidatus Eremiobacteraeota bacterium]|nr:type I polyketide synthase [Candidatus Eremiobacteraeota bacterium]
DGPRLAGVSSVNSQGEVYHVVLEGRDSCTAHVCPAGAPRAALFWLDVAELDELARLEGELQLRARGWHQSHRRKPRQPLALVARSIEELELAIEQARLAVAKGERRQGQAGVFYSPQPLGGQVAFIYPGSGNHFAGMTRELMVAFPEVARQLDATTERLADHAVPELIVPYRQEWSEGWQQRANRAIEADAHAPIFGQVMAGITATRVVNLFGLTPEAVIGYSLGESAGLFSSGVWTERDVMFGRIMNSDLFTRQLGGECLAAKQRFGPDFVWKVAVVNRPAAAVRQALAEGCDLLIVNTGEECVIGGHAPAVAATVERLACEAFYLEGITTVHSSVLEPVKQAYYDLHLLKTTPRPGLRFYSGNWARAFEPSAERAAQSIVDNALKGIDYAATIEAAYADGVRIFLEMGPHGSCARMVSRILGDRPHLARSVSLPGESETFTLLKLLAAAAAEGLEIDMSPLYDLSE